MPRVKMSKADQQVAVRGNYENPSNDAKGEDE
jgi:hypothetical protein